MRVSNTSELPAVGDGEQGFMLVGLIVAIFLILLALSVAAPRVAKDLRREREVEAVRRGNQYVRAIQLYYRKLGSYPGSMDQLEKSNNMRFLRQRYVDPMTGKADWRLIKMGEAKTTVKGFFGQPLAGIGGSPGGLGSASGMASPGGVGAPVGGSAPAFGAASAFGSPGTGGTPGGAFGSTSPTPGASPGVGGTAFGGAGSGSGGLGSATGGGLGTDPSSSGPGAAGGIGSQSATSFTGSGAPFVGVGSSATGNSIVVLNEQTTYPTWEFLYDPRIEQLKAKASLFGGSPAASSGTGLGSAGSLGSSAGSSAGTAGGFGSSSSSFGSQGSAFGTAGSGTTSGTSPGATQGPASGSSATPPQ